MKNAPSAIELFAGAGGMMLGLEQAGFETILANEVHPDPCKTLTHNFPGRKVICGDIRSLNKDDLLPEGNPLAEIDLLAGGPPCQGFSTAGMKDPDDPRNTMLGEYIRVLKIVRPKFFVLENVTGLVTLHGGRLFQNLLSELSDTKYEFSWRILHAADFGVPQMRKRLIILGARDGVKPFFPEPTHKKTGHSGSQLDFLDNRKPFVTCGDAIGDLPMIDQGEVAFGYDAEPKTDYQTEMRSGCTRLENHQASKHRKVTMDYYSLVPPGGTALDIPEEHRKKKAGIQRWPLDGISRTITTEPTDFLHPTLHRIPTVRETARIQSFPDWYVFCGQRTTGNQMRRLGYCSQTQQVGNAVPPKLAKAIGDALQKQLT